MLHHLAKSCKKKPRVAKTKKTAGVSHISIRCFNSEDEAKKAKDQPKKKNTPVRVYGVYGLPPNDITIPLRFYHIGV